MKLGTGVLALVAAALLVAGTGCANNKLTAERDSLATQNKELADQLKAERDARQMAESRATAMSSALSAPGADTPGVPGMGEPLILTGPGARTPTPAKTVAVSSSKATTPAKIATPVVRTTIPGQVLFDSGKTTLSAAATKTLDTIAATIKTKYKGDKLVVEGFTDATPPAKNSVWKSNTELAQARATAVKTYLVKKGIASADITIKGAVDSTSKNPAQSRRAEVAVLASK